MKDFVSLQTIDLERDADTCLQFRADSYRASFGSDARFWEENGPRGEAYLDWLAERITELPQGCVHLRVGSRLVGQLESRIREEDVGYVNLYYVCPAERGRGLGRVLDDHVSRLFRTHGLKRLRLSVSPTNTAAIGFYKHLGWSDLGPRPGRPEVRLMEKEL